MKHITKICLCLLCVMSMFLYSSVSHAAQSDVNIIAPQYNNAVLIDNQIGSSENNYQSTATYEVNTNLHAHINAQDGYYTGYYSFYILAANETLPSNWMLGKMDCYFTPENDMSNQYRVSTSQDYIGGNLMYITIYMDNLPCFGSNFELGIFTVRLTCYANSNSNVVAPSGIRINYTVGYEIDRKNFTAIPQTSQGYGLLYKQFITDALHIGKVDLIYDYLVQWKTTQDGYLADIELSVDDVESWLSYINTVQISQDNKLELIRQLLSSFPSYSSQMLSYMQQILAMNASQAAQAASNAAAQATQAQQASQAMAAANDFAKPDIGAMNIDPMDYVSADGFSGVSYILGSILNIPTILSMLLICVTCAFIGYALYGKKG